jgi:hypothetical protein
MSDLTDLNQKLSKWVLEAPLICDPSDQGYKKHMEELKRTGISSDETWNLDVTIAEFILPRLKLFKELTEGYPGELEKLYRKEGEDKAVEKWNEILDEMIYSFEKISKRWEEDISLEEQEKVNDGLEKFVSWYHHLWW